MEQPQDVEAWLEKHDLMALLKFLANIPLDRLLQWTAQDVLDFDFGDTPFAKVKQLRQAIEEERAQLVGTRIGRIWFDPSMPLGRGSSGTVVYSGSFEGREAAVKRLDRHLWVLAEKEISALQAGRADDCKHVVSYFGHERDGNFVYLALSKCVSTLGNLVENKKLERMGERLRVLHELALGISHLHGLGVVHRDLTPSNVLLDAAGVVKVSDMGLSRKVDDTQGHVCTTSQGTAGWQPLEVLERAVQSEKVDTFSFGCIAFFVLTLGKHPFGSSKEEWVLNILKDSPDFSPLHQLQGVLRCHTHPFRAFGLKSAIQRHFEEVKGHEIASFLEIKNTVCLACSEDIRKNYAAHSCEVAPHVMFAAEELLARCILQDTSKRPSFKHILSHPLFWSCEKKLTFLQIVSDWLKSDAALAISIDSQIHSINLRDGWQSYDGIQKLLEQRYDGKLSHLIRLVRNVAHHFRDESELAALFKSSEDVCSFFELRFPQLLVQVWCFVREMDRRTCADLAQFYVDV